MIAPPTSSCPPYSAREAASGVLRTGQRLQLLEHVGALLLDVVADGDGEARVARPARGPRRGPRASARPVPCAAVSTGDGSGCRIGRWHRRLVTSRSNAWEHVGGRPGVGGLPRVAGVPRPRRPKAGRRDSRLSCVRVIADGWSSHHRLAALMKPTMASPHGCAEGGVEPAGAQGRRELLGRAGRR